MVWASNTGTPSGGDHCGSTPTGSTTTGSAQSFSYDLLDRITQGAAGTVSYGDAGHTHAATGLSSIPTQYASYDAMGNMTCRNIDITGGQSCASGSPTGATMSYDNEGNRVLTRDSTTAIDGTSTTTDTITFDGYSEVVISAGTSTITNYYSVAGYRVAMRKGAILSYLVPDFLGSDSLALNADGSVQAVQLFAPYGSVRYSDQVMPTDYSFTGQRLDSQTGLLYYNARYYDPVSGRFTSSDTVQNNTKGMDSYAYVGDSPESRTDPSGKCWPWCFAIAGAVIGAAVGVVGEAASHGTDFGHYNWGHIAVNAGVGAVAGITLGLGAGIGAAAGMGMAIGGASSAIGALATHQSFAQGLQTTFEGAAIGGIMSAATAGMAEDLGGGLNLGGRLLNQLTTKQGVTRAIAQGTIQAIGGITGDLFAQTWNNWRNGTTSLNGGEVLEAGGLSFGGGFLGQWAYDHWPIFQTGGNYTSRTERRLQREENWTSQNDWGNFVTGASQGFVQVFQSDISTNVNNGNNATYTQEQDTHAFRDMYGGGDY